MIPEDIEEGLTLEAPGGAAWALVEEKDHLSAVKRTVYTLDREEAAAHRLVLLDDRGLGRIVYLTMEMEE